MNTFLKIRDIFYSGSHAFTGDQESINQLAFLVDEDYLVLKTITIASKNEYHTLLNNLTNHEENTYDASGGGFVHVTLKHLAAKYLKQEKRCRNIKYEHPFCGYYPDVLSKDPSIAIECGHTQNPEKILA